ncbi:unnamed protein product, partial [Amoebophrya sp. A25]|eukprot:GSA25T00015461001.1
MRGQVEELKRMKKEKDEHGADAARKVQALQRGRMARGDFHLKRVCTEEEKRKKGEAEANAAAETDSATKIQGLRRGGRTKVRKGYLKAM